MKKSIKLNAILNVVKKCCNIVIPLLVFPYISRVLGPTNYGKFSFSNSIISYFLLAAMLGIEVYAVREGSRIRDDKNKINKFISEVFSINMLSLFISYLLLIFLLIFNKKLDSYRNIILILSIILPCTVLGRDYINIIFEDYFYITVRYVIIQILGVFAIYIFVNGRDDYIIYTIIYMLTTSLGYLINLVYTRRFCSFSFTVHMNLRDHILPILILFAGQLAVTIYIQSDITMLGIFKSNTEVGVYTITSKIYMLIKGVINALTTVAIPRISFYLGESRIRDYNEFCNKILKYLLLIVLPLTIGLVVFSDNILRIIGGIEYLSGNLDLKILSTSLFFAVFSGFFCNGILVTNRKESTFLLVTSISAIINILLNFTFIPLIGGHGAATTTLISEIVVFFLSIYYVKKCFKFDLDLKCIVSVLISNLAVILICILCKRFIIDFVLQLIIAFLISILVYLLLLIVSKNTIVLDFLIKVKQTR